MKQRKRTQKIKYFHDRPYVTFYQKRLYIDEFVFDDNDIGTMDGYKVFLLDGENAIVWRKYE